MHYTTDCFIVGTGVAGLSTAIYAARYELDVIAVGLEFGGATTNAWIIENYPGVPSIDGFELVKTMKKQAEDLGAKILEGEIISVSSEDGVFIAKTKTDTFRAHTIVFALGTERRRLNLPNENKFIGKGLHYCITCDAPLYKNKVITIIGGGDASVKGAIQAAMHAKEVRLLTINPQMTGEPINLDHMRTFRNITEMTQTQVTALHGTDNVTGIMIKDHAGKIQELSTDALFVEIGATPNNHLPKQLDLTLDDHGYVAVHDMMETSMPGAFAAGDISNMFGSFKQDITAGAQGAAAATGAYRFLTNNNIEFCHHAKPHHKRAR